MKDKKDSDISKYNPAQIEKKWQGVWEKESLYQAKDFDPHFATTLRQGFEWREASRGRQKFYTLIEFPYPSGAGLHVGHVRSWSAMDAYSRKKRMDGFNVLYPIGWDAFGLPAENYAIKNKIHPKVAVDENIANFKRQIKSLGLSFDWSREVNTTDPNYYKWTQWIFLKFLEKGLAYQADVVVNWCPFCKTNLADEEVLADGTHERCGKLTDKRKQKQWLLKITAYAKRLIEDLKLVDYSKKIAIQQVNWIGEKQGINITYSVIASDTADNKIAVSSTAPRNDVSTITCFTTRPDTNFGATFIVIGPEHGFVKVILNSFQDLRIPKKVRDDIEDYVKKAKKKSEMDRIAEGRKKTGVFTGYYAINNLNGKKMPVWISDFVLGNVGTGAVVGVPGHDIRDFEFAKEFDLPIIRVVVGKDGDTSEITDREQVQEEEGTMINSEFLDGIEIHKAKEKIMDYLEEKGWGKKVVTYHLRDWVFSRQHYWGEPIPIVYCRNCAGRKHSENSEDSDSQNIGPSEFQRIRKSDISDNQNIRPSESSEFSEKDWNEGRDFRLIGGEEYTIVPVPEKDLPVELPYLEKYEPSGTGESPLATVSDWVNTKCPVCDGPAKRETDTMPNWAGSNWYYLAYLFAEMPKLVQHDKNKGNIFSENKEKIKYWMPVDIYQGGFEHTTLHLLYSRFVYKFLYDIGVVPTPEPYAKRRSHGIVLGPDGRKMSKSFGNVINPDEIVGKFGADTLRIYEMFMGPFEQTIAWSDEGVEGCYRFLKRVWNLSNTKVQGVSYSSNEVRSNSSRKARTINTGGETSKELSVSLNRTIKKVGEDLESMKFNTAVAAMMEFINDWQKDEKGLSKEDLEKFLLILAPFAPHLTEELWGRINTDFKTDPRGSANNQWRSIHAEAWPKYDPKLLEEKEVMIVVQVNGKVRDTIKSQKSKVKSQKSVEGEARGSERVKKYLEGKSVKKVVYVEGKIINFVTEE